MHTIHHHHFGWDRNNRPALRVAPGEPVTIQTIDASGTQVTPTSSAEELRQLDFARLNPVTGPIHVDGAEPGDALLVTLDAFGPSTWGWTANIPGFGLLADQFPDPALHHWTLDASRAQPAAFGTAARIPLKPFAGTIGLAPAAPGHHSIVPPRRVGGNLDMRDLAAGATLILPVENDGALFSVGDTHAAQGDGEVCGTAIESAMEITLHFDVIKGAAPKFPRAHLPGPVTRHTDGRGYDVTTGIGPDLMAGARDAVSAMIDLLTAEHHMSPVDAYMLASVAADLRISEIVDAPNWVVSLYMPRIIFE